MSLCIDLHQRFLQEAYFGAEEFTPFVFKASYGVLDLQLIFCFLELHWIFQDWLSWVSVVLVVLKFFLATIIHKEFCFEAIVLNDSLE